MTQIDLIDAYLEARRSKVPRLEQGGVERGGYFLLTSMGATGHPCLRRAITSALRAGEVDVAVELGARFLPDAAVDYRRRGNGNFEAAGELGG